MYKSLKGNSDILALTQLVEKMSKKMDLLTESIEILKKQIKAIQDQNVLVLDTLGENNIALKNHLKDKNPKHIRRFPIKTIEELAELESDINENNEKEYSSSVRAIAGKRGLKKGLTDVLSPELLVQFNLDGSHSKQRLLNYPKILNILFHGTYDENATEKSFKEVMRDSIKLAKNRFFKENRIVNTKMTENSFGKKGSQKEEVSEDGIQSSLNEILTPSCSKYPKIF